jgi:RNA recognition motif-containing protein
MNIYVSNLSYEIKDDALRQIFEEYGEVSSAKVIIDRYNGKSKGFGFVEMNNDAEAEKAIAELNNEEFLGKAISVSQARPKPAGGGGGGGRGGDRGGDRGRSNYNNRRY